MPKKQFIKESLISGSPTITQAWNLGDGTSLGTTLSTVAGMHGYNGSAFDKWRNNTEGTLLASGTRTYTANSPDMTNHNARGIIVSLRVTGASGTGGLQVVIHGKINGKPYQLNTPPTAITTTGFYAYELYPASGTAGTAGNYKVQQRTEAALPRNFYVQVSNSDSSSYTYELDYALIV